MTYDPRKGTSNYLGMDDELTYEFKVQPGAGDEPLRRSDAQAPSNAQQRRRTTGQGERLAQSAGDTSAQIPVTTRRSSQAPRRGIAPVTPVYARPDTAREPVRAVPAPRPDRFEPAPSPAPSAMRSRAAGPLASFSAFVVHLVALVLRVAAIVLAFLVVASVFLSGSMRQSMLEAMRLTSLLVPPTLLGRFVYETPFGGVLRGDLALASLILFIADWACMRVSYSLRERRDGRM